MSNLKDGTRRLLYILAIAVVSYALMMGAFLMMGRTPPSPGELVTAVTHTSHAEEGHHEGGGHADPFSFILFELAAVVGVAMLGRYLAEKFRQPSVLGELLFGVALGNLGVFLGLPVFTVIMNLGDVTPLAETVWQTGLSVKDAAASIGLGEPLLGIMTGAQADSYILVCYGLWIFSNLGVILLLFMVGLESKVEEMLAVGPRALIVALFGVVLPFGLGLAVTYTILPNEPDPVHLFLAAILCATSVGITARVFKDLGKIKTNEAKIILGAAVIDDVLGLVILAVVSGIVVAGGVQFWEVLRISLFSFVFLALVIRFGEQFAKRLIPVVTRLDRRHSKLLFPLSLCFAMAWLANQIELATIVGAFAAGLILNEEHFEKCSDPTHTIEELIAPLEAIFAPVFFVLMGMQVNLASFMNTDTLLLASAFTVAAIVGKFVSGLPAGKGIDKISVGIGMVPRGEVGLIFASIGKALGVVNDVIFSAVVVMVIVTTLITPLLLKWSLFRSPSSAQEPATT